MSHTESDDASEPMRKWLVVLMLWFVCLFNYADRQAVFSVFPLLQREMHLSTIQLGIVGSSFMWVYALFGPFAGWLGDRLARRTIVLSALLFWSLATAATAFTTSYAQLVVCRSLGGLGEAFYFPAAMSLISDYHGPSTRSRAMSLHQSGVYAGSIAGASLSGYLGQVYGWHASFLVLGCAGIAFVLVLWIFLHEPVRGRADVLASPLSDFRPVASNHLARDLFELLRHRMVRILIAVFAGANFVAVVFLTWTPTFLFQKFHMSLSMAGLNGTAYVQIASVIGVLCGGVLADALMRRTPAGRWLTQVFGLLMGVPFLFLTGWTVKVPVLLLAMAGFGFFKGLYDANLFAGLYDVVPVSQRSTAAGLLNSLGWLGGGFAPVVIALASDRIGLSASLSATAAVYLGVALLLLSGIAGVRKDRMNTLSTL